MSGFGGRDVIYCEGTDSRGGTCGKRIRRQYLGPEGWERLEPVGGRERWQCPRCQLQQRREKLPSIKGKNA